jgi:hydrogenase/urease accessory protein HupE
MDRLDEHFSRMTARVVLRGCALIAGVTSLWIAGQIVNELRTRLVDYPPVYAVVESVVVLSVLGVLEVAFGWRAGAKSSGVVLCAITLYFLLFAWAAGNDIGHTPIVLAFFAGAVAATIAIRAAGRPLRTALSGVVLAIVSYAGVIAIDTVIRRLWPV